MKIVTWNCNGAFRKKFSLLEKFDADILVIQECENPENSDRSYKEWATKHIWVGQNKNKGLGVFALKNNYIEKLTWEDNGLQQFLPCKVNDQINLLAVWTKQTSSTNFPYIGQLWKYLQIHRSNLATDMSVICGDLNSNTIWDKLHRESNHSNVVRELSELSILSLYHQLNGLEQGKEKDPTLFMHRKLEKPYHIDYAFVSEGLLDNATLEIGKPDEWLQHSDHMPIVFNV